MSNDKHTVFLALRTILEQHRGKLVVTKNTSECYRLEGGIHPTHQKPFPIAWVVVNKNYVSFHHMGVYAKPELLQNVSDALKKRMQGKSCFNFSAMDAALFAELDQLTVRAFDAFRNTPMMKVPE